MGPDIPRSFERGIISSGYWGENISPDFEGQNLLWSSRGVSRVSWRCRISLRSLRRFLQVFVGERSPGSLLPKTAESMGSWVIWGGGFSLSLWLEEPAHRLRCCLPGAGRGAAILSVECQLGLSVSWCLVRQSAHLIIQKSPKMDQRTASLIVVSFTVGGAFISFLFASRLLLPPILMICINRFPMFLC